MEWKRFIHKNDALTTQSFRIFTATVIFNNLFILNSFTEKQSLLFFYDAYLMVPPDWCITFWSHKIIRFRSISICVGLCGDQYQWHYLCQCSWYFSLINYGYLCLSKPWSKWQWIDCSGFIVQTLWIWVHFVAMNKINIVCVCVWVRQPNAMIKSTRPVSSIIHTTFAWWNAVALDSHTLPSIENWIMIHRSNFSDWIDLA